MANLATIRIALFDLETTGFPKKGNHPTIKYTNLDSFDNARVIQIGMMIYELNLLDESYKLIKTYDKTIKPDGFVIKNAHIHHITQQHATDNGVPFCEAIYEMMEDLVSIDVLVAHNLKFDKPVFMSELYRYEFGQITKHLNTTKSFCTMVNSVNITKKGNAPYKWPKLSELHDHLFNDATVNEHNALADTKILSKCFWQMYDLELLTIDKTGVCIKSSD